MWELLPMTKFTKEDLYCLHNAIDIQLKSVPMSELNCNRRRELLEKLQNMIDSYCEHEWDVKHPSGFIVCSKCELVYSEFIPL